MRRITLATLFALAALVPSAEARAQSTGVSAAVAPQLVLVGLSTPTVPSLELTTLWSVVPQALRNTLAAALNVPPAPATMRWHLPAIRPTTLTGALTSDDRRQQRFAGAPQHAGPFECNHADRFVVGVVAEL